MVERVWREGNPPTLLVGRQTGIATMVKAWRFLKKLQIELPYDPAIPLPGIYLEKNMIQKDTYIPMFTAALFTIAKTWKQPKCPFTKNG